MIDPDSIEARLQALEWAEADRDARRSILTAGLILAIAIVAGLAYSGVVKVDLGALNG